MASSKYKKVGLKQKSEETEESESLAITVNRAIRMKYNICKLKNRNEQFEQIIV